MFEAKVMADDPSQSKNPFKRTNSQNVNSNAIQFPPAFPKNIPGSILNKSHDQLIQSTNLTFANHPEGQSNNAIFRGYMKDGKKHGLCAFRFNSGEIVLTYYYQNLPVAFEATIFYSNGESCSVMNENGTKGSS